MAKNLFQTLSVAQTEEELLLKSNQTVSALDVTII